MKAEVKKKKQEQAREKADKAVLETPRGRSRSARRWSAPTTWRTCSAPPGWRWRSGSPPRRWGAASPARAARPAGWSGWWGRPATAWCLRGLRPHRRRAGSRALAALRGPRAAAADLPSSAAAAIATAASARSWGRRPRPGADLVVVTSDNPRTEGPTPSSPRSCPAWPAGRRAHGRRGGGRRARLRGRAGPPRRHRAGHGLRRPGRRGADRRQGARGLPARGHRAAPLRRPRGGQAGPGIAAA